MIAATDAGTAPRLTPPRLSQLRRSRPGYCSTCGQKAAPLAPTLGYFVHELTHEVLNVDGKIFRSLRLLLTRPGISDARDFRRAARELRVADRLYLVASILAFAIGAFGSFDAVNVTVHARRPTRLDPAESSAGRGSSAPSPTALNVWLPRAMFVLVPLFAALVMLFRRRSGHTYPQHLYFALHVHAAWFLRECRSIRCSRPLRRFPIVAPVVDVVTRALHRRRISSWRSAAFTRPRSGARCGARRRSGCCTGVGVDSAVAAICCPVIWPRHVRPIVVASVIESRRTLMLCRHPGHRAAPARLRAQVEQQRPRRRGRRGGIPGVP